MNKRLSCSGSCKKKFRQKHLVLNKMYLSKLIHVDNTFRVLTDRRSQPSVFDGITLYQSQHAEGPPEVIRIIISIKQMAEESNEEPLSDGYGINNVFLRFIDLSLSWQ